MFWQDFESTDEEGDQEDVDATAENMLRQEEHRARKVGIPLTLWPDCTVS